MQTKNKLLLCFISLYYVQLNYYNVKPTLSQSDHKNVFPKFPVKAATLKLGLS